MQLENALVGVLMVFCVYVWIWWFVGFGDNKMSIFVLGAAFALFIADMRFNGMYGLARTLTAGSAFFVMWVAAEHDKKTPPIGKQLRAMVRYFDQETEP